MSTRDLLIFMAVITFAVGGITALGWFYFARWYREEKDTGRQHIDAHLAEVLKEIKHHSTNDEA